MEGSGCGPMWGIAAAYFWCDVRKNTITSGYPVQNTRQEERTGSITRTAGWLLKGVGGTTSHVRHAVMGRRWCEGTDGHVAVAWEKGVGGGVAANGCAGQRVSEVLT